MDNVPPSPTPTPSSANKFPSNRRYLWMGVAAVVLVVVGVILLQTKVTKKLPSVPGVTKLPTVEPSPLTATGSAFVAEVEKVLAEGKIPASEKVATVGQETIYGADVTFLAYYSNKQFYSDKATTAELLKKTFLPTLIDNSIMLQAGKKMGLVQLSNDIFNNPKKDQLKRLKAVNDLTAALKQQQSKLSGAGISIWYFNQRPPKIPLSDAKTLAQSKIQALYDDLKAGKITIKQAGDKIKADKELAKIDGNYVANAYYEFKEVTALESTNVPEVREAILKLKPNELTNIINIQENVNGPSQSHSESFTVVQLTARQDGKLTDLRSWLDEQRKQFQVQQ